MFSRRKSGFGDFDEWPSASRSKTADRPHFLTLALGGISSAVAITAVILSYKAIRLNSQAITLSRESTQLAQRAYLAIKAHTLVATSPSITGKGRADRPGLAITGTIINSGNTPAYGVTVIERCLIQDNDRHQMYIANADYSSIAFDLAPKAEEPYRHVLILDNGLDKRIASGSVVVWFFGNIEYRTVFPDIQDNYAWCIEYSKGGQRDCPYKESTPLLYFP